MVIFHRSTSFSSFWVKFNFALNNNLHICFSTSIYLIINLFQTSQLYMYLLKARKSVTSTSNIFFSLHIVLISLFIIIIIIIIIKTYINTFFPLKYNHILFLSLKLFYLIFGSYNFLFFLVLIIFILILLIYLFFYFSSYNIICR